MTTKILHRSYFHNDFIFVRPAVATEYIESDEPGAPADLPRLLPDDGDLARRPGAGIVRTSSCSWRSRTWSATSTTWRAELEQLLGDFTPRANFQIQVLSSLFFRNKGAYVVGKIINGFQETPFALPILHGPHGAG